MASSNQNGKQPIGKFTLAYARKLYLAHLMETGEYNMVTLSRETGMSERAVRPAINNFQDVFITVEFIQHQGRPNGQGHYKVIDWGPNDPEWVKENIDYLKEILKG